jgi:hypothetical protein
MAIGELSLSVLEEAIEAYVWGIEAVDLFPLVKACTRKRFRGVGRWPRADRMIRLLERIQMNQESNLSRARNDFSPQAIEIK